jgi:molecular chaperone GrpE
MSRRINTMDENIHTPDPATGAAPAGPAEASSAAGEAPAGPSLEERLAAAEALAARNHESYLRALAESENIRRRSQEDIAKAHKFAVEAFAGELLPVKDSLEASLTAANLTLESLRSGVELTLRQLQAAFEKSSVREVNPVGEKFDPNRHQAISAVASDQAPNTVLNVLQKGYTLFDRTLRPALVTVAKAQDS